jgi:hypothetical protein
MRDALLFRARLFVPQLTAEHARRLDLGRKVTPLRRIPPRDRPIAKQIAGFPGSAYAIRHTAPRILAIDRSTSPAMGSFHCASRTVLRLRKLGENVLPRLPAQEH